MEDKAVVIPLALWEGHVSRLATWMRGREGGRRRRRLG